MEGFNNKMNQLSMNDHKLQQSHHSPLKINNNNNNNNNESILNLLIQKEDIIMNKLNNINKLFDIEKNNYSTLIELIYNKNTLRSEIIEKEQHQRIQPVIQTIENQQNKIQHLFNQLQLIIINNHTNINNYLNINNLNINSNQQQQNVNNNNNKNNNNQQKQNIENVKKSIENLTDWCKYSNELYEIQKYNNVILKDIIFNSVKENWEMDFETINKKQSEQYQDIQSINNYLNSLEIIDNKNTLTFYYSLNNNNSNNNNISNNDSGNQINENIQNQDNEIEEEEYINPNDEYIETYEEETEQDEEAEKEEKQEKENLEDMVVNNRYQNFTFLENNNDEEEDDEEDKYQNYSVINNSSLQKMLSSTSTLLSNRELNSTIINNNEYGNSNSSVGGGTNTENQENERQVLTNEYLINNIIKDLIDLSNDLIEEVGRLKDDNQHLQDQLKNQQEQDNSEDVETEESEDNLESSISSSSNSGSSSTLPPIKKNIKNSIENITNINNNINYNIIKERDDLLVKVFTMEMDINQLKSTNDKLHQELVEKSLKNFERIKELDLIKTSSNEKNEKLITSLKQLCESKENTIKYYKKENVEIQKLFIKVKQDLQQEKQFNQKALSNWDELSKEYKKLELNYNNLLNYYNSSSNSNNILLNSGSASTKSTFRSSLPPPKSSSSTSSSTSSKSTSSPPLSINYNQLPDSIDIYKSNNINKIKDTLILQNQMRHSTNSNRFNENNNNNNNKTLN